MTEQRRIMITLAMRTARGRYLDACLRRGAERRTISWLEAQFDLIAAATIAEIGEILDTTEAHHGR